MADKYLVASLLKTVKHIGRVQELLGQFASRLIVRGAYHDRSKFDPVEYEPLARMDKLIAEEGNVPYGSEEYKKRTDMLGEMITHHRQCNSHHPEHFTTGIAGMSLFDVVEMFADWKAASERGEQPTLGLEQSIERFKIEPQLAQILRNTARELDWEC